MQAVAGFCVGAGFPLGFSAAFGHGGLKAGKEICVGAFVVLAMSFSGMKDRVESEGLFVGVAVGSFASMIYGAYLMARD